MDILGSIMKNMVKPPVMDEKERLLRQQQQIRLKKEKEETEIRIKKFREDINKRIHALLANDDQDKLVLEPMDKVHRAIVHDIADGLEFSAFSFGTDEVDRHVVIFKVAPCEGELSALRRGETYVAVEEVEEEVEEHVPQTKKRKEQPEYLNKYQKHLGGLEVAKEAARSTKCENRSYGFVSSEQKKDKRTIEETLADIRARKKMKNND